VGRVLNERQEAVVAAAETLLPGKHMSPWQRNWCTPEVVDLYLNGRNGDIDKAGEILAKALSWRQDHKEILSGLRVPIWSGDMRVLTRSESGHPVVYFCAKAQPTRSKATDVIEHMALVLETAVKSCQGDARSLIIVGDLHGFRISNNLNPEPVLALARMLQQPYRDRLHTAFLIDAPWSFSSLWRVFSGAVTEATRAKVNFAQQDEAMQCFRNLVGTAATDKIVQVMESNRQANSVNNARLPSEVE
jgi:ribosomal protein S28E/S33